MSKQPLSRSQRSADRIVAAAIYVLSGVFAGAAVGIATGQGWLFTGIGLVAGILVAVMMARRTR